MFEAKRQPTLSEQAYNQIKDAICQGSVAPGDILSENQIAQQLGMSPVSYTHLTLPTT